MLRAAAGVTLAGVGTICYQAATATVDPPPSPPIAKGKTRICVTGYSFISPPTGHAHLLADAIARAQPDKYETWYYWSMWSWSAYMVGKFASVSFPPELKGHSTSPFVWLESGDDKRIMPIGGDENFADWAKKTFAGSEGIVGVAREAPALSKSFRHSQCAPATAK